VIGRLKNESEDDYQRWQSRDLSARRYVYVWANGVYLQARMEPQAECMLAPIGATREAKKSFWACRRACGKQNQSPKVVRGMKLHDGIDVANQEMSAA
jgi:putative transposase